MICKVYSLRKFTFKKEGGKREREREREEVHTNPKFLDLFSRVVRVVAINGGFGERQAFYKAHGRRCLTVISTETPQMKILTLSLILMSCMTLGKWLNLSLQTRKLRLRVLI